MRTASAFSFHHEKEVRLNTSPEDAFVYLDDFRRLSAQTARSDLLVIAQYQLGFALGASGDRSLLRVLVDYDLPQGGFARWWGKLLGGTYARWCVERMASDAAARFPLAAV